MDGAGVEGTEDGGATGFGAGAISFVASLMLSNIPEKFGMDGSRLGAGSSTPGAGVGSGWIF